MSQWLTDVIDRGAVNDWLSPVRDKALAELKQTSWPTRRTEAWKYTSLKPLEDLDLSTKGTIPELPVIDGLDSIDLVFADGELKTDLSSLELPAGVRIESLANASKQGQATAEAVFSQVKPGRHLFGLINDVLVRQGLIIDIDAGVSFTTPLRIVNLTGAGEESHQRVLVRLGDQAKACVIEQGLGEDSSFSTGFAEYQLGQKAQLEHYRLAMHTQKAVHIGGSHFDLYDEARLNSTLIGFGSQLARLDVDIAHRGEHAKAKFNNVYLLGEGEHFDLHSTIEHAMPNGTTEENARGIVGDRAKAVFNGRIHIHRGAQKTLAELNNRNLLLSRRGQINTKPELEIYADDVQCAHGATVAEIDEQSLYYLMTRGIPRSQALVMLNFGFIQELVNQMPNKALAEWLQPRLKARFEEMEVK
ncbi:FeS cluster assembly protein SufD [Saliniradius amylolyticus]|uniref:FeS cluster assembly protein SufD n=1 Tax=Saliniradius amylolyticus TaxID=2183582 RepID=A0A2S2E4X5_9ALTE|nr:Fe-S cluster assembly protein SufD [Saliniradius amylolyticus]AWL12708.1 FeS cluster assembly protein SufD [Saliniradius amylolyticus]